MLLRQLYIRSWVGCRNSVATPRFRFFLWWPLDERKLILDGQLFLRIPLEIYEAISKSNKPKTQWSSTAAAGIGRKGARKPTKPASLSERGRQSLNLLEEARMGVRPAKFACKIDLLTNLAKDGKDVFCIAMTAHIGRFEYPGFAEENESETSEPDRAPSVSTCLDPTEGVSYSCFFSSPSARSHIMVSNQRGELAPKDLSTFSLKSTSLVSTDGEVPGTVYILLLEERSCQTKTRRQFCRH